MLLSISDNEMVEALVDSMSIELDNDGQVLLYTGLYCHERQIYTSPDFRPDEDT